MQPVADVEEHNGRADTRNAFEQLAVLATERLSEDRIDHDTEGNTCRKAGAGAAPDPAGLLLVARLLQEGDERDNNEKGLQALAQDDDCRVEGFILPGVLVGLQPAGHGIENLADIR